MADEEAVQPNDEDRFLYDQNVPTSNDQLINALAQARDWERVARTEQARRMEYEAVLTPAQKRKLGLEAPRAVTDQKTASKRKKK